MDQYIENSDLSSSKSIDNKYSKAVGTRSSMNHVFTIFMNQFGLSIKSITVDHGKEFSGY